MGSQDRLLLSDLDVAASKALQAIQDTRTELARVAAETYDKRQKRAKTLVETSGIDFSGSTHGKRQSTMDVADETELDSAAAFRKLLKKTFGSVEKAWKNCMDEDRNGELSYPEFVKTCKVIGFRGKPQSVFAELDLENNGVLTLQELDPDAGRRCVWEAWRENLWDNDLLTTAYGPVPLFDMPYFRREEARRNLAAQKNSRREALRARMKGNPKTPRGSAAAPLASDAAAG
jgi:hypothetical protein